VPISRARPIKSLYSSVIDYDHVIVPDNPLASALNRRVTNPQLGTFATTPRRLASGRREQAEDRLAFLEVVDRTDHSWKAIAYAIGNILQCWEHHGAADEIFDYDAYTDETTEAAVDIIEDIRTTSGQLTDYEIDADEAVAVVGYEQLTQLERSILPADHDRVELFTDDPFDHPPFHVFDSSADIVDALLDTITPANAADVAVVLDSASRYSSLVESALDANDIPYYGGPGFVDHPDHRAFVRLLRTAFRGSEATVADAKPVLTRLGASVAVEHDEKQLTSVDVPDVQWLTDFCVTAGRSTFDEAVTAFVTETGRNLERFSDELSKLGFATATVTQDRVEDLAYYLQTYDVPVDREDEGVLLADARSSGYVDRSSVFYLGLDDGWTHAAPQRPWVDTDAQFERYIRRFQLLLQSGTEQYYLVQDTAGGQPVTPCLYFGELLDAEVDRFSDLESVQHSHPEQETGARFEREPVGVAPDSIETISQSSLNSYVNSPRDYFFGRILDGPDKDYYRKGNLFHDFAEFCVNHPDHVDDDAIEAVVDLMLEETGSFFHDGEAPLRRREYRIGLDTIVEYLDANPPESQAFLTPASGRGDNTVADHFGLAVDSPLAERRFENAAIGAEGKLDLVLAADHIVDYKSGRKQCAYTLVKRSSIDPVADTPNFQAALYLSHFRSENPGQRIQFSFCHFLETLDDVIAGEATLDDALTTIEYYPDPFDDFLTSREAYTYLLDGYTDCVATFEDLGFAAYQDTVESLSFPETTAKAELRDSAFSEEFTAAVQGATSDDLDAEKGCDQAIRELDGVRKRAFFREDLDAFEAFVSDRIEEINHRRAGVERFPINGPGGEPNYRRVDHRDLMLEGERDD
jgi:hypothetical protein